MANEIQRPKRVHTNVEGIDFTYTKSRRKRPTEGVWIRQCLLRRNPIQVEFLATRRGRKCICKKNNPADVTRTTEPWDPQPVDPATGELVVEDEATFAEPNVADAVGAGAEE